MKHYLQYFNVEKMGRFPNGADAMLTRRMGVFTKLASVKGSEGSAVFVIAGLGKPKRYFLWEAFTVENVTHDGEQYTISGPGWILFPPQPLQGKPFDAFKASCAHFIGFRAIDELPYHAALKKLAEEYHLPALEPACETFCDELVKLEPKNGDSWYYRATVRQALGKTDPAKEDFKKAIEIGTNFRHEAELALKGASPAARTAPEKPGAKDKIAEQVVTKGRFAKQADSAKGDRKPFDMPDTVWQAIRQRRGQDDFRQKLLRAYGGRCAITGAVGEAALEAAYLAGDDETGPHELANGILLRSDLHTLFDLNLIRIHPRSKKVVIAEPLKKSTYARFAARQIRLPEKPEERPSVEALAAAVGREWRRWKVMVSRPAREKIPVAELARVQL